MNHTFYEYFYGHGSFNERLFLAINHLSSPLLDTAMPAITYLGGSRLCYLYFFILALCCLVNHRLFPFRLLVVYGVATFVGLGVEELLKGYLRVPRPPQAIGADLIRQLGHISRSFSLPSGHAVFSFMTATTLTYGRSICWKGLFYLFAVLVAWSRVYVGAHYPLDVLVGAVVGICCGLLVWKLFEWSGSFLKKN